jgi:hypothetical protein
LDFLFEIINPVSNLSGKELSCHFYLVEPVDPDDIPAHGINGVFLFNLFPCHVNPFQGGGFIGKGFKDHVSQLFWALRIKEQAGLFVDNDIFDTAAFLSKDGTGAVHGLQQYLGDLFKGDSVFISRGQDLAVKGPVIGPYIFFIINKMDSFSNAEALGQPLELRQVIGGSIP